MALLIDFDLEDYFSLYLCRLCNRRIGGINMLQQMLSHLRVACFWRGLSGCVGKGCERREKQSKGSRDTSSSDEIHSPILPEGFGWIRGPGVPASRS